MERKLYNKILRAHRHLAWVLHSLLPKHTQASSLITDGHGAQRRKHIPTCRQLWLNSAVGDSGRHPSARHFCSTLSQTLPGLSCTMGPAAAWPWGCLLVATSRSNRALPQWPVLLPKMWHCRGTATLCTSRFPNHLQPCPDWMISTE